MSLSAKLTSIEFQPVSLLALNRLAASAERILSRWPDIVPDPPERDRDRLVAEMLRRVQADDWHDVRMSFVIAAARALFDSERRRRADLGALRRFYFDEIAASDKPSFLSAMLSIYIGSFEPSTEHTRGLSQALAGAADRFDARSRVLVERIPEIFSPAAAPEAVAGLMLAMQIPWDGLKAIGIRSPHAEGLMDYVHKAFVSRLAPQLGNRDAMERLIGWLKPAGQSARSSGAADAISALLKPWQDQSPTADDERYLTASLVDLYGDPRVLSERSGPWMGVPESLLAIVLRWLTGENIRFFLDIVSAVEDSHMWQPRREFWLGLHKQKRIDAAWVALSSEGADLARRKGADRQILRFGLQTARQNTSLLILKIGSKIVVEGSHSYKVHVFRAENLKAPKLYQRVYDCEDIRKIPGAWSVRHSGDWQGRVLEQI